MTRTLNVSIDNTVILSIPLTPGECSAVADALPDTLDPNPSRYSQTRAMEALAVFLRVYPEFAQEYREATKSGRKTELLDTMVAGFTHESDEAWRDPSGATYLVHVDDRAKRDAAQAEQLRKGFERAELRTLRRGLAALARPMTDRERLEDANDRDLEALESGTGFDWRDEVQLAPVVLCAVAAGEWHLAHAMRFLSAEHRELGAPSVLHELHNAAATAHRASWDALNAMVSDAVGAYGWHGDVLREWHRNVEAFGHPPAVLDLVVQEAGTIAVTDATECPACRVRASVANHGFKPYEPACDACRREEEAEKRARTRYWARAMAESM